MKLRIDILLLLIEIDLQKQCNFLGIHRWGVLLFSIDITWLNISKLNYAKRTNLITNHTNMKRFFFIEIDQYLGKINGFKD